jgi:glycosidase
MRTSRAFVRFLAVSCLVASGSVSVLADDYDLVSRLTTNPGFTYKPSPEDWRDVNMYQLFTDRFYDGNAGNNLARYSTAGNPWYNVTGSNHETNRHFFQGGDWAGVKQKLGYLKDMGVNCIWLSGVQLNEQGNDKRFTPYHAYHPANFYKAEPMFGTFAELKDLIDTAHSNGIYVVLDVVVNHMADLMKYTDCNCNYDGYCDNNCAGLTWWNSNVKFGAPFDNPSFFHNNGTIGDNDWDTYPKYVKGAFLGTEDLNTENATVQSELTWAFKNLIDATDCDGFRVDAIKHMEFDFIRKWADDMRVHAATRGKGNFLLFGEYFSYSDATQASYCKDNNYSFNSTLWFPMQMTLKNVFAYEQGTQQLVDRMNAMAQYNNAATRLVTFMDNHDVDRIALECGTSWEAKLKPALTFLYAAMPVPCLFYGTEHGFNQGERRNGSPKLGQADFQRECMMNYGFQWGNANGDKFVASALYNHIKKLNELRNQYISLRRGSLVQRWAEGGKGLFALSRVYGNEESLIAINTDWTTKSMNPQVAKPDGTVFVNVLNPTETVTVSGGRLSFSVESKGSKIFVAGLGGSAVETACNATTLTITYRPNGGPLASPVGSIRIGIGHDGNQGIIDAGMTPSGNAWTYSYALTNATNDVTFWFHDEAVPPTYDNNSGQNWSVVTKDCGDPTVDLAWIGNTYSWPAWGEWDPGEVLWVNIESYPQTAAIEGSVVYSVNGSTNWQTVALEYNGTNGNNDAWHVILGSFSPGSTVKYAVRLRGRNGDLWDNNSTLNFSNKVNAGTTTVQWVGNTHHWPETGAIEPDNEVWVNIESWPIGAGVTGEVVYSSDGGATWSAKGLSHNGAFQNNDWWHANLGTFNPDATVRYAVKVTDGDNIDHWDNNNGSNFIAVINPAPSSIRWFGNAIQGGAVRPDMDIRFNPTSGALRVEMGDLSSNAVYTIMRSYDLITWSNIATVTANAQAEILALTSNDMAHGNLPGFYRVRVDWVPGPVVHAGKDIVVSIETWPIGGATAANLVYSSDGGSNWNVRAMTKTGTRGNNDVWTAGLGTFPIGTIIKYAVEVIDDNSQSQWANNSQQDYQFQVVDTNFTDGAPPTTSFSPQNTTTTNLTLAVTLSASDDTDPSPTIYYTTNGAAPSTGSTVYSGPINVVDAGSGVDLTIKFFARDASGNTSSVTTIDVKVNNNSFVPGGSKPYSVNPTLGKRVSNGAITVDGANSGEWTTNNMIALDMVNDDPRSLGSNWTMHEAPIDLSHIWAAWDDTYLYVAWQYVDVTDILDPANAGGAGGGKISSNDGILQWLVLDTIAGSVGATNDMWQKKNSWAGADKPDYQIYLAGSLWQGYISRATNSVFPVDDGGVNYKTISAAGITAGKGSICAAGELWGVGDADNRFNGGAPDRNFIAEGHSTARDSFYEIRIPLAYLGLSSAQLESTGIGIMIGAGSMSAMDCVPNDATTLDTQGVEVWNSSFEWGDTDRFTVPFARIGAAK